MSEQPMTEDQIKERIRGILLEEVKAGKMAWYYISIANREFLGSYVIQARGPTEAWTLLHRLGWFPYDAEDADTRTNEVPPEVMARIPAEQRWRRLSREESINLGKEKT